MGRPPLGQKLISTVDLLMNAPFEE